MNQEFNPYGALTFRYLIDSGFGEASYVWTELVEVGLGSNEKGDPEPASKPAINSGATYARSHWKPALKNPKH